MMTPGEVAIPLSKKKLVLVAVGAVGFVALGAALLFVADAQSEFDTLYVKVAGIASIIVFGLAFLFVLRKLFDRRPGLIVSDDGIVDNSSAVAAGPIPWSEIEALEITSVYSQRFLTINVAQPEKYLERGGTLQRLAGRANHRFYGSPVQISANALKINFDDLVTLVERRWEMHRSGTPRNPPR